MSGRVSVRFYAELNDLLPPSSRFKDLDHDFVVSPSVKDVIESFGVPHTEVDMVVANGEPVSFSYRVNDGDRISVFPVFESLDVSGVGVSPEPLRRVRFLVDANLGKLVRLLRLLGFDSSYEPGLEDAALAARAAEGGRVLLTRDRELLKRNIVQRGYFVRSQDPEAQAAEVLRRFDLAGAAAPFTRCPTCNGSLKRAEPDEVRDRLEEGTARTQAELWGCEDCERVYWRGAHFPRLAATVERILAGARGR